MTNAQLILDIYETYENTERIVILNNLNTAIAIGKSNGKAVDRYVGLPQLTNRSKHTVMQWFQRDWVKIPLRDLGIIAEYLGYNIYTFFMELTENTTGEFLAHDAICNEVHGAECTKTFNKAVRLQNEMPKDIVIDNLEEYWGSWRQLAGHSNRQRYDDVMACTGCTLSTYRAWFAKSRVKDKIPLVSICKLAEFTGMDVFYLLENEPEKQENSTIS